MDFDLNDPLIHRAEALVLWYAAETEFPLADLQRPDKWADGFNTMPGPSIDTDSMQRLIASLQSRELIECPPDGYYGLTPKGGLAWESLFQPDWSKYIEQFWFGEDASLTCVDRRCLQTFFDAVCQPGWFQSPRRETAQWREESPFEATYWKTFPTGHCVEFEYEDAINVEPTPRDEEDQAKVHALNDAWHRPWEEVEKELVAPTDRHRA